MGIESHRIVSVGGGINLRPAEFKQISRNSKSPKILEITRAKQNMKQYGQIAKNADWICSVPSSSIKPRINTLPASSWEMSKSINGVIDYKYRSDIGDFTQIRIYPELSDWQLVTNINGYHELFKRLAF